MWDAFRKLLVGPLMVTLRKISSFSFGDRRPRDASALDLDAETFRLRFELDFDLTLGVNSLSSASTLTSWIPSAVSESFGGAHSSGNGGSTAAAKTDGCLGDTVE